MKYAFLKIITKNPLNVHIVWFYIATRYLESVHELHRVSKNIIQNIILDIIFSTVSTTNWLDFLQSFWPLCKWNWQSRRVLFQTRSITPLYRYTHFLYINKNVQWTFHIFIDFYKYTHKNCPARVSRRLSKDFFPTEYSPQKIPQIKY